MKQALIGDGAGRKTICRFRHRFSFWVCNLSEIVSIQMNDFQADFKRPRPDKDGYFWGWYVLLVGYRCQGDTAEVRQRRFTRGFLIRTPYASPGAAPPKYVCSSTFAYQTTPLPLMLFPLFSRLNRVPFKIEIDVYGEVHEPADAQDSGVEEAEQGAAAAPDEELVDLDQLAPDKPIPPELPPAAPAQKQAHHLVYDLFQQHEQDIRRDVQSKQTRNNRKK